MTAPVRPSCSTCPFMDLRARGGTIYATCRRRAPVAVSACWAGVDPDTDWCGEHPGFSAFRIATGTP